jgi:hypothetical protein
VTGDPTLDETVSYQACHLTESLSLPFRAPCRASTTIAALTLCHHGRRLTCGQFRDRRRHAPGLRGVDARDGALGDVIVSVNGKPVQRLSDQTNKLNEIGVGGKANLRILRNDRSETVTVAADVGQSHLKP